MCHPVIGLKIASGCGAETSAGWCLTAIQSNLGTESLVARQRLTGSRGFDCEQPHNCRTSVCGEKEKESVGVNRGARDEVVIPTVTTSQVNSTATSPYLRNRMKKQL